MLPLRRMTNKITLDGISSKTIDIHAAIFSLCCILHTVKPEGSIQITYYTREYHEIPTVLSFNCSRITFVALTMKNITCDNNDSVTKPHSNKT